MRIAIASNAVPDLRREDETQVLSDVAPLTVVIPVRNRAGQRLRNSLRSLYWQTGGRPAQVIVVSFGSTLHINKELSSLCAEEAAKLIIIGDPCRPWNKSLALNVGIRATLPEVPLLATMDADMILAPSFLEVVLERLQRDPPALVLCRISDLPARIPMPPEKTQLLAAFAGLQSLTRLRPRFGSGGFQAARRAFFFDIRGYDEDLHWWGAMDKDLVNRARLAGLDIEWIEERTAMLHQWHPRKHKILTCGREIDKAKLAWRRNHEMVRVRSAILKRNSRGWGGVVE